MLHAPPCRRYTYNQSGVSARGTPPDEGSFLLGIKLGELVRVAAALGQEHLDMTPPRTATMHIAARLPTNINRTRRRLVSGCERGVSSGISHPNSSSKAITSSTVSTLGPQIFDLLRQQAQAGDIILLFGDESEALTHPYLARAWAKRG
jgi:hypothetical protein